MDHRDENLQVIFQVVGVLDRLGIRYALGGSWVSALLSAPRFTQDADISAAPFAGQEAAFCSALGPDYYVSLLAVQDAIRNRSSFNVIHIPSSFKVDIFINGNRPFDAEFMARARPVHLGAPNDPAVNAVSAEDIILLKLEWYRMGNEVSDQQWRDVVGVLKHQAGRLDNVYLDKWATTIGVDDLLAQARQDAG